MTAVLALGWVFISLVTTFDIYWFVTHSADFNAWENNPVAYWLARTYGVWAPVSFRVAAVLSAVALVEFAPRRTQVGATVVAAAVHAYLLTIYLLAFCGD